MKKHERPEPGATVDIAAYYSADPNVVRIDASRLLDTDHVFDVWGNHHALVKGSVRLYKSGVVKFRREDQPHEVGQFDPGEITVYREARP